VLDIKLIREKTDFVRARLALRGAGDEKLIEQILQADEQRRTILTEVESLKSQRNRVSKEIGALMGQKKLAEAEAKKIETRDLGDKIAELVQSDIDFHRALVDATRSSRLRRLHESVIGEAHLCMSQVQVHHLLHPQVIADEHARILAMIEAGDADQATSEMTAHISRAGDRLVAYFEREKVDVASDPSGGAPV